MMLAGLFSVIIAGCDREARYKILTFFFEGVPPLDGEENAMETEITTVEEATQPAVAQKKNVSRILQQRRFTKHDFVTDCNKCHMGGMGSGERQLIRPMPDLCYSCHTDYYATDGYLHGPIAVGECVFCHNPHKSKYVYLQEAAQPELCFRCHVRGNMVTITDHQEKLETICTDCHDPHVSSMKMLLKPVDKLNDDPNTVNLSN
jgi:predicted CXXCH cytochrome family protein